LRLLVDSPVVSSQTRERSRLVGGGSSTLDSQPEAQSEARMLEPVYTPARSKLLIGSEANEARVKQEAGRFSVIHFAAPAVVSDAAPLMSHVALGDSESGATEDGLLEAWEISNLDLKADVVVYGASENVARRATTGSGMNALGWATFIAGCPTTILSLWKGESANELVDFHRALVSPARNSIPKAKALGRAMIKTLRDSERRHPYYWAGLVLMGNPR
jgi:CHAT domain-containing protein